MGTISSGVKNGDNSDLCGQRLFLRKIKFNQTTTNDMILTSFFQVTIS